MSTRKEWRHILTKLERTIHKEKSPNKREYLKGVQRECIREVRLVDKWR